MALTFEQIVEFGDYPYPILPSGDQNYDQAVNLAIHSFRYVCQLEGLPIPSEDDVRTAIGPRRSLRLTFVPESRKHWYGIEAKDAEAVLAAWNALPAWSVFDPVDFRWRIVEIEGAGKLLAEEMPGASDSEILNAVVIAAGPGGLLLERGQVVGLAGPN